MKNTKYFNDADILHFKEYCEATTKAEKDKIYNRYLYTFIDKQIDAVMKIMNSGASTQIMNN